MADTSVVDRLSLLNAPAGRSNNAVVMSLSPSPSGSVAIVNGSSVQPHLKTAKKRQQSQVERAVFSHLQALRALGKYDANTADVADALNLRIEDVHAVLASLSTKGVKKK